MTTFYTTEDLYHAYTEMGVQEGDVVYLTGNFGALGFHQSKNKHATIAAHLEALQLVLGSEGTVVVPTHSFNLCNTDTVFDLGTTAGQRGAFTEFVRTQPGAVRQFHPFASLTALGKNAELICGHSTRHAYGPNTPYERLLNLNAWGVSVGLSPRLTCSVIHHIEQVMAVPYRYTKEFIHPVMRDGEVSREPFYLYVLYRECDIERDRNEKLFQHPALAADARTIPLGMGQVTGYRMAVLRDAAVELMTQDIYHWLKRPPETRPYQK
jgi:aminoglycoside 3-N-acetyltransferase